MHDIKESIKILFQLLPEVLDTEAKKEFDDVKQHTIEQKDKTRGCDYRTALIDLTCRLVGLCDNNIYLVLRLLCEVSRLAYLPAENRNSREVVRFCNVTYMYGVLFQIVFSGCKGLSLRKMFGIYYHIILAHMAIQFFTTPLSSLNAEDDERQFAAINSISRGTSNRKPDHILSNSILRIQAERKAYFRTGRYRESRISDLAKDLPKLPDTKFDLMWMKRSDYQAHVERLSPYAKCGVGVWWHTEGDTVVWHDSDSHPSYHPEGPPLLSFVDVKREDVLKILRDDWSYCLQSGTQMPIPRVSIYGEDGNPQEVIWKETMQAAEVNISSTSPTPSTITPNFSGSKLSNS